MEQTIKVHKTISNIDKTILFIYLALVIMGLLNIYAAVYSETHKNIFDLSMQYGKQLMWITAAFVIGFSILLIDSKFFPVFTYPIYAASILMLLAALFLGKEVNGARAWFEIGGLRIQPDEFVKISTCLAMAKVLSRFNVKIQSFKTLALVGGLLGLPGAIILLQNDTGSMIVYAAYIIVLYRMGISGVVPVLGAISVALFILAMYYAPLNVTYGIIIGALLLYYIYNRKVKEISTAVMIFAVCSAISFAVVYFFYVLTLQNVILGSIFLCTLVFSYVAFRHKLKYGVAITLIAFSSIAFVYSVEYIFNNVLEPHQRTRINVLLGLEADPKGAEYNVDQSKIAIGSGGLSGKGYLQGTQTKFNFVPEQSTDFIFCTVGEEWGFWGSFVVIGLFILLLARIIIVAEKQRSLYSKLYGYSVASIIFFHFAVNVGMTIGMVPVIGIPLPFFSYGGSSLWSFTILLFIFLRLDLNRDSIIH